MHTFEVRTSIKFGEGSLNIIENIKNKRVLIITDPFMVSSGLVNNITSKLKESVFKIFSDIQPDPPLEIIAKGVEELKNFIPDVIIALGGGSCIDASKAIVDFSKGILDMKSVEFIAVPTTSGTGSEVTSFSVITNKEQGIKYPLVSDEFLPNIAILDPTLVQTTPPIITADTGMDVLTHAIEAYVSTDANDFSDALAEKSIELVCSYLSKAYEDGNNIEAREKMHNSSCLAGLAFNHVSLGINHSIAHALGAKFHIPHGRINSVLLPYVIEYNANTAEFNNNKFTSTAIKYAKLATKSGLTSINVRSGVKNFVKEIKKLQKNMNMPTTLVECGVDLKELNSIKYQLVDAILNDVCTKTNPRKPSRKDILEIIDKISS